MTAKPRWGWTTTGRLYHLVGGSTQWFHFARCGPVLAHLVNYTPTEDERCLRCRKMAEAE